MSDNEKQQEPAHTHESAAVEAAEAVAAAVMDEVLVLDEPAAEPAAELPAQLPGEILAARREEMRLSIEEVSARLKLAPRQIVALEADDFAQLPGLATVRGFVRSYAKLLELAPEPLIASLVSAPDPVIDAVIARRPLPSPGFSGRRYSPPTRHRSGARRLSGLAVVILVFVGTLAFIAYRNDWLHMPSIDLTAAQLALTPASDVATAAESGPVNGSLPAVVLSADSALQLKASQDTWVEVIAVDGERKLVSKLVKAGTSELVEVAEPVVLVVGNAAGIEAILRGQALNLRAAARDNVAKLSLK